MDREELNLKQKHVLSALVAAMLFVFILIAVQTLDWGLIEMTGGFFIVGLAGIPYEKWVKFVLPLFFATTAIGFAAMATAVVIAY